MERQSLISYVEDFRRISREIAYVQKRGYRTERWTYQQLADLAFQFAGELEARQIGKGDHVLLWGVNSAEWVAVFLGCMLRGTVVVPVDDTSAPDFVQRVYRQVEAKLLVCGREHLEHARENSSITLEELASRLGSRSNSVFTPTAMGKNDPLEIVFTSGTTAEPKGVVITHGNVIANIAPFEGEIRKYLKYEKWFHPIRFLNLLPLSHVFGQFLGIFLPPLLGGTVLFQESLNPSEVMGTIKRERVSVLVAVPRILQSLKDKIERDLQERGGRERFHAQFRTSGGRHFLRRWWMFRRIRRQFGWKFWAFICGGAALDRPTEEFWGRLGYAVIQGYGLTETTSLITVNHPFKLGHGSIGKVLPGREMKLAADGEILVRGGGVASSYVSGRSLQPVAGEDGWYHTGDIGELDAHGNLYFRGRKKEVIVTSSGMNVYPEDLEAALRRQPEVRDCVVVGLNRDGNAEPCAVVILRNPETNAQEVVNRTNASLAGYQRMNTFYLWPEGDFPRTSTQKPRRTVIANLVSQKLGSEKFELGASPLADLIARFTHGESSLTSDADLHAQLGLSSLDRVELMSALEDRFQLDLGNTSFAAVKTVGDLEKLLRGTQVKTAQYHYPKWALRWPVTWVRLAAYYLLIRPAILLLGSPRVTGRENLNAVDPPVLVVSNHLDDVDPGFILTALPGRFRHRLAVATGGEALESLRTPPADRRVLGKIYDRIRWILGVALLNLFPLPREAGFRKSFQYAGEAVDQGFSVLVFPEGRHSSDGKLLPFRAGIGLLATHLGIPVVPVRIHGLFEIKQAGKKFAAPGAIRVNIGAPLQFPARSDPQWIAQELQKKVAEL